MMLSEIGEFIKKRRKEIGLTQEEVAKKAGISRATLSKLENGKFANISMAAFDRILNSLVLQIDLIPRNPFYKIN